MNSNPVILKPGKEKAIKQHHHWVFSGAVQSFPASFRPGDLLPVCSYKKELLGWGYFNPGCSLVGRMLSFGENDPWQEIKNNIEQAIDLRKRFFNNSTTAYRLINGEGDCLPGLIVDRYGSVLVLQISTLGIENIKSFIINCIKEYLPSCTGIYEKSSSPSRKEEKLPSQEGLLYGIVPEELEIKENNLNFLVSIPKGQKTGFFLDQREMRSLTRNLAHGKRVLNTFCYTGGFSVSAASGGATKVDSVDLSEAAIDLARKNMALNGYSGPAHTFYCADVFDFLRTHTMDYDLFILDPPAFAKKKGDQMMACRGYKDINRLVIQNAPTGSLLLTCSCSYHVDSKLFQQVIFQASAEAGRKVKILGRHQQALDHPINLFHPEGEYLKSLLLYITND